MTNYAIITENDESKWDDNTGVSYHFPIKYKNKLLPDTKVIYYKGSMTNKIYETKRLSKQPHYFGIATIKSIKVDKENPKQLYAEIEDYLPFKKPIIFKDENGNYLEEIPDSRKKNYWYDGVRAISESVFLKILDAANIPYNSNKDNDNDLEIYLNKNDLISITEVVPILEMDILQQNKNRSNKNSKTQSSSNSSPRYSRNSKVIGDRAEEIVYNYLKSNLNPNNKLQWLSKQGETPGYDICYIDDSGKTICVEVKGTTSEVFKSFIITFNEWQAAKEHGDNYHIYFVSSCLSKTPKIQIVRNPILKETKNEWSLTPISYNVDFI